MGWKERIEDLLEEMLSQLPEDLRNLKYETISLEEVSLIVKDRLYRYVHLKGYSGRKTYTLRSYPLSQAPFSELTKLVALYRSARHLRKAADYAASIYNH